MSELDIKAQIVELRSGLHMMQMISISRHLQQNSILADALWFEPALRPILEVHDELNDED